MNDNGKSKVIDDDKVFICLDDDQIHDTEIDLLNSFKSSFKTLNAPPIITLPDDDDDDISASNSKETRKLDNPNPGPLAQPFVCDLCTNSKPQYQSLKIKGCGHFYCCECIENYVFSKLGDRVTDISCPVPDCFGSLDPEYCKDFFSAEVYHQWGNHLCESSIVAEQKCYCPFADCSILLVDDGGVQVTRAECPYCYRLFCAVCRVVWHEGLSCEARQNV